MAEGNAQHEMKSDDLITVDREILGGTPVFKGTRVPVKTLFDTCRISCGNRARYPSTNACRLPMRFSMADARLVRTETSQVVAVESITGDAAQTKQLILFLQRGYTTFPLVPEGSHYSIISI